MEQFVKRKLEDKKKAFFPVKQEESWQWTYLRMMDIFKMYQIHQAQYHSLMAEMQNLENNNYDEEDIIDLLEEMFPKESQIMFNLMFRVRVDRLSTTHIRLVDLSSKSVTLENFTWPEMNSVD